MPIETNRVNRACPNCNNPTTFNVDGKEYFCGQCLTITPIEKKPKEITTVENPAELVNMISQ